MYDFNYHRPETIEQALALFAQAPDGLFLAGGHTILPSMKQRLAAPTDLIDLGRIAELRGVRVSVDAITIGATTCHDDVATSVDIISAIPALSKLAGLIGDAQVRNRGTIGGSVANSDPAADYPSAVLALGATVTTDKRSIAADDFFKGMFETALDAGEMITHISFPKPARAAYVKYPNPASRYATVGVFIAQLADASIRVAITGAGASVFRAETMEAALTKEFSIDALDGILLDATEMNSDMHASAEYRAHLCTVMAKKAVAKLVG